MDIAEEKGNTKVEIHTKDYKVNSFVVATKDCDRFQVREILRNIANGLELESRFAFFHRSESTQLGWNLYIEEWQFGKYGITYTSDHYFKLVQNENGALCKTYPRILCVPVVTDIDYLQRVAKYRTKRRLPVLTYLHQSTGASLWRSSQPKTKFQASRNQYDIEYLAFVSNSCPAKALNIFDARPVLNALANIAKGGGYETERKYEFSRVTFLDIANIHAVREAFQEMKQLPIEGSFSDLVKRAGWLEHVSSILRGAVLVASSLEQKTSALVHCSDGWDRTAQLCTLAQLMLDSSARSLEGFAILIEKDWLSFGHRFEERLGLTKKSSQSSPIFTLFLDAVWQLLQQFPTHFEYNERLLLDLNRELYKGRFGTFMCSCELDRARAELRSRTVSVWSWIFANKERYRNPYFQPGQTDVIYPVASIRKVEVWQELFWPTSTGGTVEVHCTAMSSVLSHLQLCRDALTAKTAEIARLKEKLRVCN